MKKSLLQLLVFLTFSPSLLYAQTYSEAVQKQKKTLQLLAEKIKDTHKTNFKKAEQFAKKHNLPILWVDKSGNIIKLQGLDNNGMPLFLTTHNNAISAATIGTNKVWPGGTSGLNLSGNKAQITNKLALWDGAHPLLTHREFENRITIGDKGDDAQNHSTHVAGTLMARGISPPAKGMAFQLQGAVAFDFDNDNSEMAEAAAKYGLLVSNHSYGNIAGWRFNDSRAGTATDPNWEWWGNDGDFEDYKFGIYNADVAMWDQIAFNAPYYLIVKSAGNNQNQNGPAIGEPYYQRNSSGVFALRTARQKGAISNNDSYDNLSTNSNAKNILVVGAISGLANGYTKVDDISLAPFSSWGGTDDGRIKPDVVANGVNVLSTYAGSNDSYGTLNGTSMAAPSVAGSALLLQQHYSNLNNNNFMRSATLKGLITHTTDETGPAPGPDYKFGWGLMNTNKATKVISENNLNSLIKEATLSQGQQFEQNVIASGKEPLIVTLSWTDPVGPVTPDGTVDSPNLKLINDLDVRVIKNGTIFSPWILDPSDPSKAAGNGDNFRDNIEKIFIENPEPGEVYTIRINHKGSLSNGNQTFSLIASGIGGNSYCLSGATSTTGIKINNVQAGSFTNPTSTCNGNNKYLTTPISVEPGKAIPLNVTLGNCGAQSNGFLKVYVDWNSNGNFNDSGELLATSNGLIAPATFSTSINVPSSVAIGNAIRMRIIAMETNDPNQLNSCGQYANGETEEYILKVNQPEVDCSVNELVIPTNLSCATFTQKIAVTITNNGKSSQNSIPVTAEIRSNGNLLKTITENVNQTIQPGKSITYSFKETFTSSAGISYVIKCFSRVPNDQVPGNDTLQTTVNTANNPTAPVLQAFKCDDNQILLTSPTTDGTVIWYDSANATTPVAIGNNTALNASISKVYGSLNTFEGTIGPKDRTIYGGTTNVYNQFTPSVKITAMTPIELQRARLYIGHSGVIRFTVTNEQSGEEVSSVKLDVTATRNPEASGSQGIDVNDQGMVYDLNLKIPSAGNYLINIDYEGDATIFRNRQDNATLPYPFTIPGLLSVTGNTATSSAGVDYKNYWYYFYDLSVKPLGCISERSSTDVINLTIEEKNGVLFSNSLVSNQWFLNGSPIEGATSNTYTPSYTGTYTVKLIDSCTATSNELFFSLPFVPSDIGLKLYPVPSDDFLNVKFNVWEPNDVHISIINSIGQIFYTESLTNYSGPVSREYALDGLSSGIYYTQIVIGKKSYGSPFSITK
ncbi:S8 family serine peptidase [Solitalea lacus]|uniref:S8 family serine peptidase n=1 Tax=Solitalea lacus TaxID=2911172 RepID=UPI001EDA8DA7|nr:S8 family serine peptidase [Solitalea lacus]UKJ07222.1 S8 family serine peptidase [Solitalea lacus]